MAIRLEDLITALRRQAITAIAELPQLKHTWEDHGAVVTLRFPPADDHGFEVAVQAGAGYLYVLMGNAHHSFDVAPAAVEEGVSAALGVVRDLLSPAMRLRELRSNGKPYKWIVEARDGQTWKPEAEEGLLFFNYFGSRTEHVSQNRQLPSRLAG